MTRLLAIAMLLATASCLDERAYPCATNLECRVDGVQGACHPSGFCVYPDGRCPSEQRYGPAAGNGLALECVPPGGVDGNETNAFIDAESSVDPSLESTTPTTAMPETSIDETATGGCGSCNAPPSACFEPIGACEEDGCVYAPLEAGTACELDDPCVTAAACDGSGNCLVTRGMTCDNPPGPCDSPKGVCEKDGTCSYEPLRAGTPCDDGDGCTTGEQCDGAGACTGGDPCETDDPCATASCVGGRCEIDPVADGTQCGANSANRCCDGACVDISSDEANCGGCGVACQADDTCETVSATSTCDPAPAATSGRCTCDAANADCPLGQVCRTVTPFNNRCTPNSAANCVDAFQDIDLCPNYCFYD